MDINFKLGSTTGKAGILSIECQKLNIPYLRFVLHMENLVVSFYILFPEG